MSGNDKNTNVYSASDIQKYLRGELSAPEMQQLELAALEDPLLSDALEGIAFHHSLPAPSSFRQDLGELQQRLDKRVGKKDKKGFLFRSSSKAAAVLILLVGLGLSTYFLFFTSGSAKSKMAEAKATHPGNSAPVAVSPVKADSTMLQKQDIANNQPPALTADKSGVKQPKAPEAGQGLLSREKQVTDNDRSTVNDHSKEPPGASPAVVIKADKEKEVADDVAKMDKPAESAAAKKSAPPAVSNAYKARSNLNFKQADTTRYTQDFMYSNESLSKAPSGNLADRKIASLNNTSPTDHLVFNGKVIDQNNRPLSGAALYLSGNYLSNTTTDKNGNFSLTLPKNDTALRLTVGYVGYEQTSLGLSTTDNRTSNVIQLQPQAGAMNEVVVIGYGAKRKEILQNNSKPQKESLPKKAGPVNGWPAYQSYLDMNKTAVNPDATLKGTEIISFIVNKEGTLSSFKVEQSLSPAHDSAAIHLIQQGPSWKLLKGKRTRAWVTISF